MKSRFVLIARWAPTIIDTLIPLALGCLEGGLIESIGHPQAWVAWVGGLLLAGAAAYWHSLWRIRRGHFEKQKDFEAVKGLLRWLSKTSALAGLACVVTTGADQLGAPSKYLSVAAVVSVIVMVGVWTLRSECTLRELFERAGLPWGNGYGRGRQT